MANGTSPPPTGVPSQTIEEPDKTIEGHTLGVTALAVHNGKMLHMCMDIHIQYLHTMSSVLCIILYCYWQTALHQKFSFVPNTIHIYP